jgi:hypothetical protein
MPLENTPTVTMNLTMEHGTEPSTLKAEIEPTDTSKERINPEFGS